MSLTQTLLRSPAVAALTSPHGVDRYLELVNPMWAAHEVRARVVRVERETLDVTTLTLRPTSTWDGFRAGQHVQVGVEIDSVRHTRCFSVSSSDLARKLHGDPTFTITVRADVPAFFRSLRLSSRSSRSHRRLSARSMRSASLTLYM